MECFIAVSTVQICQKIDCGIETIFQSEGQSLTKTAVSVARKGPIEVHAIFRDHSFRPSIKSIGICQRQQNNISRHIIWDQFPGQSSEGLHTYILAAIVTRRLLPSLAGFYTAQAKHTPKAEHPEQEAVPTSCYLAK